MRQTLVDFARARHSVKRGEGNRQVTLSGIELQGGADSQFVDFIDLDSGLASVRIATDPKDLRIRPGHLAGTIQYLSLEQVLGKPARRVATSVFTAHTTASPLP